jgi:hypothetical protein
MTRCITPCSLTSRVQAGGQGRRGGLAQRGDHVVRSVALHESGEQTRFGCLAALVLGAHRGSRGPTGTAPRLRTGPAGRGWGGCAVGGERGRRGGDYWCAVGGGRERRGMLREEGGGWVGYGGDVRGLARDGGPWWAVGSYGDGQLRCRAHPPSLWPAGAHPEVGLLHVLGPPHLDLLCRAGNCSWGEEAGGTQSSGGAMCVPACAQAPPPSPWQWRSFKSAPAHRARCGLKGAAAAPWARGIRGRPARPALQARWMKPSTAAVAAAAHAPSFAAAAAPAHRRPFLEPPDDGGTTAWPTLGRPHPHRSVEATRARRLEARTWRPAMRMFPGTVGACRRPTSRDAAPAPSPPSRSHGPLEVFADGASPVEGSGGGGYRVGAPSSSCCSSTVMRRLRRWRAERERCGKRGTVWLGSAPQTAWARRMWT